MIGELLLKLMAVAAFANLGWQVAILLKYERMAAHLDEYETYALERWRRPLLPLVYEQRRKLDRLLREQQAVVLICGACCLVLMYVAAK